MSSVKQTWNHNPDTMLGGPFTACCMVTGESKMHLHQVGELARAAPMISLYTASGSCCSGGVLAADFSHDQRR
jgi:hypothetical protein